MKNIKEIIRGNDAVELEFKSKKDTGSIEFKNGKFNFNKPVELEGVVSDTFISETMTGDDAGISISGQLSVGSWDNPRELVVGGDSTTETMVVYHTDDDLAFTDITDIAASDHGSTFGLFNGTEVGKSIYIGSDFKFFGIKAKIDTNGIVEQDNIVAEYWDGTQWQAVPYMSSNSNPPLHSHGNRLGQHGHSSEQWRFSYNTYGLLPVWEQSEINGITKYWGRFRIVTPITQDIILEQIKLHTNRFEVNSNGESEYFGTARYKKTLLSGVSQLINNQVASPANQNVTYISGEIVADYNDNRFNNNVKDSKLFILNIDEGLDTSIPIEVRISYYVAGTATGDIEWVASKIPVADGFSYDGSATRTGTYSTIDSVTSNSNLIRRTSSLYIDVCEGSPEVGYVIELSRDADNTNLLDTLEGHVVVTHVVINGYFWKS